MKKLFSTRINNGSFALSMLMLRLSFGILIMKYGYDKLIHFNEEKGKFMNFLHLGSITTLSMVIFAEFFCGALLILGLFTRLAAFVLVINMSVVVFIVLHMDFFKKAELATLYLAGFLVLLLCGPGKISIDNMISK